MRYCLYDVQGKMIKTNTISSGITEIEMEGLIATTYLLKVMQKRRTIKTFKIVKAE